MILFQVQAGLHVIESEINLTECTKTSYTYIASRVLRSSVSSEDYLPYGSSVTLSVVFRSTDSQLKLWNVGKPHCLRSFKGHINEKNFVGLASNGDYIACGE